MNNFFVNIVARTFTSIEKVIDDYQEKNDDSRYKSTLKELEYIRMAWKDDLIKETEQGFLKFDHAYQSIRLEIKKKLNIRRQTIMSSNALSPNARQGPDYNNNEAFMVSALTNHLLEMEDEDSKAKKESKKNDSPLMETSLEGGNPTQKERAKK